MRKKFELHSPLPALAIIIYVRRIYTILYLLFLFLFFLTAFFHPITAINVDLGRHLLFGKIIINTHHVPKINLLSYTYTNFPYINTSWLTDVFYFALFNIGGFNLLLLTNTILIAFAFGLLVYYAAKQYFFSLATLFGTTLYLLLLSLRPDVRPEVMSMICMTLFMVILYSFQNKKKISLLYLIPIELLWVNLHIYYFVGPLLIIIFLLDSFVTHHSQTKAYILALTGTTLVTLFNPNGIQGTFSPLFVLRNYGFPVTENQDLLTLFTTYHSTEILLPITAILLLFLTLFLARKNTKPLDWLLAILFSIGAIIIFRNILLFIFATLPSFITHLNFICNKYRPMIKKLPFLSYFFYYPLSLLLLLFLTSSSLRQNGIGFGFTTYGEKAVDFLLTHQLQGPFYNNFDIGDYLSYRIYPQLVFVDNRPEAYPTSFFQNSYLPMQNNPTLFKGLDQKYHFNALIIEYWDNTPWGNILLKYLVNNSQFKLVYLDQYMIILLHNTPKNKNIIANYRITKSVQINNINEQGLIHYLFFFAKVGWNSQVRAILQKMKKADPQFCMLTHYPLERTSISSYIAKYTLTNNCSMPFL